MNKKTIITLIVVFAVIVVALALIGGQNPSSEEMSSLIDCFNDNDLVIYGASTCPACKQLVSSLGGKESVESIYVECTASGSKEDQKKCQENAKTGYVPEIQIDGEVYEGSRDPASLAGQVNCEL
jgi:glutaredoxin